MPFVDTNVRKALLITIIRVCYATTSLSCREKRAMCAIITEHCLRVRYFLCHRAHP